MSDDQPQAELLGFGDTDLDPRIVEATQRLGFESMTPIQARTIPLLLKGADVIGGARTGSGKTAAFGLPLLHKVKDGGPQRALVLAPTRELALQVTNALRDFAEGLSIRVCCIYGGASYDPQIRAIRKGATVIVATPGRLLDLMKRGVVDLSSLDILVLDEADEMLRMGFIDDVETILEASSSDRQVALFSATMPDPIRRVAVKHLEAPEQVDVEGRALSVDHIQQSWIRVAQRNKLDTLVRVLQAERRGTTLVFSRTRLGCAEAADALAQRGISVEALHGNLNQAARERVLMRMRSGHLDVVIATDVAARGIDVNHITHVINFDLPGSTEDYVHRIGRTGRAGREGTAITFVTSSQRRRIQQLQKSLSVRIQQRDIPTNADVALRQRDMMRERLTEQMEYSADARLWLQEWIDDGEHSEADIAAAALSLLAKKLGTNLAKNIPEPPRRERRDRRDHDGSPPDFRAVNEVQIFLPVGHQRNVEPGDVVGALTRGAGLSGDQVGKITLLKRKCFVGLSRSVADKVLAETPMLKIRGREVPVSMARPSSASDGPRGGRKGPPRRSGKKSGGYKGKRPFKTNRGRREHHGEKRSGSETEASSH